VRPYLVLVALPLALAGCVNTDAAVFVEPTITDATAAVSGGLLGVTIAGKFKLNLHLGPRASDASKVDLREFNILDAKQSGTIAPIQISKSAPTFPLTVDLDSDVSADLDFDGKDLPKEAKTDLCAAAGVIIGGVIQDSLQATSTPFFSPIVHPTGCP
jgi:hypothetical protein